ncbi:DNA polymerase III subunit chi [Castellaniella sp. S9]|uniref:DNA polymerase III subunit chi n=1 Tax=Castellaniella sp. S9 TaxID=2993652 RepID=UPI0022B498C9|nr:DNA polymerase III subunit chi [Castellaniella sp. S9]
MSRIDFAFGAEDRLRMACRTAARHADAGRRLLVYCTDPRRMRRFDALLWSFEPASFVTHAAVGDPLAAEAAVLLAAGPEALDEAVHEGWLLNLDLDCPPGAGRFERVLEIVSGHEADIAAARHRWLAYKAEGHELRAHDLAAGNLGAAS